MFNMADYLKAVEDAMAEGACERRAE